MPQDPKHENWKQEVEKRKKEKEEKRKEEGKGQAGGQAGEDNEGKGREKRKAEAEVREKRGKEEAEGEVEAEGEEKKGEEVETGRWYGERDRVIITVDSQQLAEILGGHICLKVEALRPLMEAITGRVNGMRDGGKKGAKDLEDPVAWVPRELNRRADKICNEAMDRTDGHSFVHARIREIIRHGYNLKISSDGGIRAGRKSAIGWSVWAVRVDSAGIEIGQRVIMEGSLYYPHGMSSL